jgi:hypothetical protein
VSVQTADTSSLEYYFTLDTWPEPIRTPLKAAIKAKNRGDWERSETYFRKYVVSVLLR